MQTGFTAEFGTRMLPGEIIIEETAGCSRDPLPAGIPRHRPTHSRFDSRGAVQSMLSQLSLRVLKIIS
jgi:hypothetical protein